MDPQERWKIECGLVSKSLNNPGLGPRTEKRLVPINPFLWHHYHAPNTKFELQPGQAGKISQEQRKSNLEGISQVK